MKKLVPALVASAALVAAAPASANSEKYCAPLAGTAYEDGCLGAIDRAVEMLNEAAQAGDSNPAAAIKPKRACADVPRKKDRKAVERGTPFSQCVKAVARFKRDVPPPPPAA